jgi:hypothetical protein
MRYLLSIIFIIFLSACEKGVDFKLNQMAPKLVVEATIENEQPPIVILSNSINYFSKITPELLAQSFVRDAEVFVSNGSKTHRLKEYSISLPDNYRIYYYSIDSANLATAFTGQLNTEYSLRISTGGEEYNAMTTIPGFHKQIDSVYWKPRPRDSSEVSIVVKATDAVGYGDYVRYWTKTNSEPLLPGIASVFDDLVIDGTTYELEVEPGFNRNADIKIEELAFKKGDTVTLKLSGIDKQTYDFWRTMEYTYASVGNPFSSPIKVTTNISNGALGYFGGYASQYRTIIIPR